MNYAVYPHLKHANTQSPVWWDWNFYKALGEINDNSYVFKAKGVQHNFNFADIMSNLQSLSASIPNHQEWTFVTDLPYNFANATSKTPYDGAYLLTKVRAYEQWLHSVNARHTRIANDALSQSDCSNLDSLHQKFATKSYAFMQQHQIENGRADRYRFESWYQCTDTSSNPSPSTVWVPTRVTPEDQPYTYTWLAKQAIKFLKGIKDTTGALETLALTKNTVGSSTSFTVTNNGDIESLVDLQDIEAGSASVTTQWFDASNNDITAQIKGNEGWVDTALLQPGASVSVRCKVAGSGNKTVYLEAFWNPQDPTGIVRDRATVVIGNSTSSSSAVVSSSSAVQCNPSQANRSLQVPLMQGLWIFVLSRI